MIILYHLCFGKHKGLITVNIEQMPSFSFNQQIFQMFKRFIIQHQLIVKKFSQRKFGFVISSRPYSACCKNDFCHLKSRFECFNNSSNFIRNRENLHHWNANLFKFISNEIRIGINRITRQNLVTNRNQNRFHTQKLQNMFFGMVRRTHQR